MDTVAGYSAIAHIRLQSTAATVDIFAAARWMTSMFSLSIVTQVTATTLIAAKLWRSRFMLSRTDHLSVIWMIVESGAILTASTLAVFVLFLLDFNAGQFVSEIAAQLGVRIIISLYSFYQLIQGKITVHGANLYNCSSRNEPNT